MCHPLNLYLLHLSAEENKEQNAPNPDDEKIKHIEQLRVQAEKAIPVTYHMGNDPISLESDYDFVSDDTYLLSVNFKINIKSPEFIGAILKAKNNFSIAKITITHQKNNFDQSLITFFICSGLVDNFESTLTPLFSYLDTQIGTRKIILTSSWDSMIKNERFKQFFTTLVDYSIQRNNNSNIVDCYNTSLLSVACAIGDEKLVTALIQSKAWWYTDHHEKTPLHYAAQQQSKNILAALFKTDYALLDLNSRDKNLATPLLIATQENQTESAIFLLEKGANPNLQEFDGNTALHIACAKENLEIVKLLLDHGARNDLRNNQNVMPIDIARQKNNLPLLTLLGISQ